MLPYDQLLAMIGKLRFKDDTALRTIGLAPLAKTYDAYPVHDDGRKLYCLLKKGAEVPSARKLTPQTAINQIIVLRHEASGVAKVWPHAGSAKSAEAPAPAPQQAEAPAAAAKAAPKDPAGGSLEFVEEE